MGIASAGKACLAVRQLSGTGIFLKKGLTRRGLLRIIIKHSFEALRNCVMVAPATLTRIVKVRILLPQP